MKAPKTSKITSRSSSITNAFIQAILPTGLWTEAEEVEALSRLGMARPVLACSYCGDTTSEWDHLFPLVRQKKPTGFIHEIRNLVPSCGRCNHSKSGGDWHVWFRNPNSNSPTKRNILDREKRFERLEEFVKWGALKAIPFHELVHEEELKSYWAVLDKVQIELAAAQRIADRLKPILQGSLDKRYLQRF